MSDQYPSYLKCFLEKSDQDKQEDEKALKEYKDIISSLPKQQFWGAPDQHLYNYQGFWYHPIFNFGVLPFHHHFEAQPTDLLLSSLPKSGTTWLKSLAFSISTRSTHPFTTHNPHDLIPNLENQLYNHRSIIPKLDLLPSPRILSTHVPYTSLPQSILASDCKIVHICRDPKDTFVSLWNFGKRFVPDGANYVPIELAFEQFCEGLCICGPFWEHVLSYWRASLERPERVLFLKYEEMVSEPEKHLRRLAEFMGKAFSDEEEKEGVVEEIRRACSFERMSNLEVTKVGVMSTGIKNSAFYRKGKVGDWENYLTVEMAERIDGITEGKFRGSGLVLG